MAGRVRIKNTHFKWECKKERIVFIFVLAVLSNLLINYREKMKDKEMEEFKELCKKGLEWAKAIENKQEETIKEVQSYLENLDKDDTKAIVEHQEKPLWSKDGMALKQPKEFWLLLGSSITFENFDDSCKEFIFQTEERAELERDRREVDYTMKKMACESREDNDWRYNDNLENLETSFITYRKIFFISKLFKINQYKSFNTVYFNTEQDAQKCLDHLIEKYGEKRLKEIWGIK